MNYLDEAVTKSLDEFMEYYKVVDTEEIYSNGIELVPIFRVKQWEEYNSKNKEIERLNNKLKDIKSQLDYLETYSSKEDVFEDMKRRLDRIEDIVNRK